MAPYHRPQTRTVKALCLRRRPGRAIRAASKGVITVVALLFLIGAVVFALVQMHQLLGKNVSDGQVHSDSNAAFFLAESGLERAQTEIQAQINAGSFSNTSCTGISTTTPYPLPPAPATTRGTVSLTTTSTPANCAIGGATPCTECQVQATGEVGTAKRTLTRTFSLTTNNGTSCSSGCGNNPVTWKLDLKNNAATAALALFNLAYIGKGNNTATFGACQATDGSTTGFTCLMQSNLESGNGNGSVAQQVNTVVIPGTKSSTIYQTMSKADEPLIEVGVFFRGSSVPTLAGGSTTTAGASSYWSDRNTSTKTVWTSGSTAGGGTNNGTATTSASGCNAPKTGNNLNNTKQDCTSWCSGGDALVFNFTAAISQPNTPYVLASPLTGVTFGTNPVQRAALTPVVKYPDSTVTGEALKVQAETWYVRNANFSGGQPESVGASSFKAKATGSVGLSWTDDNSTAITINSGVATLTVASPFSPTPSGSRIYPDTVGIGDRLQVVEINGNNVTLLREADIESGPAAGGAGGYTLKNLTPSTALAKDKKYTWRILSRRLNVSCSTTAPTTHICNFASGDSWGTTTGSALGVLSSNVSGGGTGVYAFTGNAQLIGSGTGIYAGTAGTFGSSPGNLLYLPSSANAPAATDLPMWVALKSTTIGQLTAPATASQTPLTTGGTTVTAVATQNGATVLTLGAAPASTVDGATLCAGTCALFNQGASAETYFQLSGIPASVSEWTGSFTCLKGVTSAPTIVTSTTTVRTRWFEVIKN